MQTCTPMVPVTVWRDMFVNHQGRYGSLAILAFSGGVFDSADVVVENFVSPIHARSGHAQRSQISSVIVATEILLPMRRVPGLRRRRAKGSRTCSFRSIITARSHSTMRPWFAHTNQASHRCTHARVGKLPQARMHYG